MPFLIRLILLAGLGAVAGWAETFHVYCADGMDGAEVR